MSAKVPLYVHVCPRVHYTSERQTRKSRWRRVRALQQLSAQWVQIDEPALVLEVARRNTAPHVPKPIAASLRRDRIRCRSAVSGAADPEGVDSGFNKLRTPHQSGRDPYARLRARSRSVSVPRCCEIALKDGVTQSHCGSHPKGMWAVTSHFELPLRNSVA